MMLYEYKFTAPVEATVEVPAIPVFWDRVQLAWTILCGHKFLVTGQQMQITITDAPSEATP